MRVIDGFFVCGSLTVRAWRSIGSRSGILRIWLLGVLGRGPIAWLWSRVRVVGRRWFLLLSRSRIGSRSPRRCRPLTRVHVSAPISTTALSILTHCIVPVGRGGRRSTIIVLRRCTCAAAPIVFSAFSFIIQSFWNTTTHTNRCLWHTHREFEYHVK